MQQRIAALVVTLGQRLSEQGLRISTAESCTGGGIAKALTDRAGSSGWFEQGYVTYSNASKSELLMVPEATLIRYGAVSEPVVAAMVEGALQRSGADSAVAVSGIAGPGGGSADKPVGLVCFAWQRKGAVMVTQSVRFFGNRDMVRDQTLIAALQGAVALLDQ